MVSGSRGLAYAYVPNVSDRLADRRGRSDSTHYFDRATDSKVADAHPEQFSRCTRHGLCHVLGDPLGSNPGHYTIRDCTSGSVEKRDEPGPAGRLPDFPFFLSTCWSVSVR